MRTEISLLNYQLMSSIKPFYNLQKKAKNKAKCENKVYL